MNFRFLNFELEVKGKKEFYNMGKALGDFAKEFNENGVAKSVSKDIVIKLKDDFKNPQVKVSSKESAAGILITVNALGEQRKNTDAMNSEVEELAESKMKKIFNKRFEDED